MGPNSISSVTFSHVAPLARLRGGMDAESNVKRGELGQLPSGEWYAHCKWCDEEARLQVGNEEEAYGMLDGWRLSIPGKPSKLRFWSCPTYAEYWQDPKPKTTDTIETAGTLDTVETAGQLVHAAALVFATDVVRLNAEIERPKAEIVRWIVAREKNG